MTEKQVNKIVEQLCAHLGPAARQPNATGGKPTVVKDLVFDPKEVKTALLIGLNAAGIVVVP
jgi:hypothetical protein